MRRAALALLLLAAPAAAEMRLERRVEASDCGALVADVAHEFAATRLEGAEAWVDLDARSWRLDEPAVYRRDGVEWAGEERYRVGDGAVRMRVTLSPEAGRFRAALEAEPAGDFDVALAQYLPGVALPCRAEGALSLGSTAPSGSTPRRAARVHALLRRATEALYDQHFAEARAGLDEAARLAPGLDTVWWMRARVAYLEGEALPAGDRDGRLAAFERAERFADEAVSLAPEHGEGWLWRGIARGRITTTQAGLAHVLDVLRGDRGPHYVAESFERAIALEPEYVYFGFSAAGDARVGAAQLYRLLPGGAWARPVIGVARDLDRAVALAREALAMQPVRIEYAKELGVALLCRSGGAGPDLGEAQRVLRGALALPVRTPYEQTDWRHARELLDGPAQRACGYSRDAWDAGLRLAELAP